MKYLHVKDKEARMLYRISIQMFKSAMRMAETEIKRKTVSKGSNSMNEQIDKRVPLI